MHTFLLHRLQFWRKIGVTQVMQFVKLLKTYQYRKVVRKLQCHTFAILEEHVTYLGARHSAQHLEKIATDNLPLCREKIAKTYPSFLQPSSILERNQVTVKLTLFEIDMIALKTCMDIEVPCHKKCESPCCPMSLCFSSG